MTAVAHTRPATPPEARHRPRVLTHEDSPDRLGQAVRVFFRYPSPRLVSSIALLALAARLWVAGWSWWDLAVVGGVLAWWPVQEWLIHVFILHFQPRTLFGRTIDPAVPRKHRQHHLDPWRIDLLFIPVQVFYYAPFALAGIWWLAMPTLALALTGFAFFFLMALHYEWVHYIVHTRVTPRTWFYKRLWKHHRLHHFKNENYWWGVSMLAGDHLLGTAPDHREVETSPNCITLLGKGKAEAKATV